jgi:predicted metal-binding membrane protein
MHGTSETSALGSFLGMWIVMMAVMMLPSSILMLWRYRQSANAGATRLGLVAVGYFFVWTLIGVAVFPIGFAMHRLSPIAVGVVVLVGGVYQITPLKAHHLACCGRAMSSGSRSAWRHGLRLGLHCARCCGNLMAVLLVTGVMDVRAMAVVGLAIAAERFGASGQLVAKGVGVVVVAAALSLIGRALVLV